MNLEYQIAASVLIVFLVFVFFSKNMLQSFSDRLYLFLMLAVCYSVVLDIFTTFIFVRGVDWPDIIMNFWAKLYLLSVVLSILQLFLYILLDTVHRKKVFFHYFYLSIIPAFFGMLFICTQPVITTVRDGNLYYQGAAEYLTYGLSIAYLLGVVALLAFHYRSMRKETRQTAILVLSAFTFFMFTKIFIKNWCFESLLLVLMLVYIYLTMSDVNSHLDKRLGIFNQKGFENLMTDLVEDERENYVLYIGFDEFKQIQTTFGVENVQKLFENIVNNLKRVYGGRIFRMDTYELACVFVGSESEYRNYAGMVRYQLRNTYDILDAKVQVPSYQVEIPVHKRVKSYTELYGILRSALSYATERGREFLPLDDNHMEVKRNLDKVKRALDEAFHDHQVKMLYQPILNVKSGKYEDVEALLYMEDSDGNPIDLDNLVMVADEYGMMPALGLLVVDNVFLFMSRSELLKSSIKTMHINLSGSQMNTERLSTMLKSALEKYQTDPKTICYEIRQQRESLLNHEVKENMRALVDTGSIFSLDEYGKGYANLETVMELPIAQVKIDSTLLHTDISNEKGTLALEFVLEMAKELGLKVAAKDVETVEDYMRMKELHVDYMQGHYLSDPLDENEFLIFMQKPLIKK